MDKPQLSDEEHNWKTAFRAKLDFDEGMFKENNYKIYENDPYIARYDLVYLTPSNHQLKCKVIIQRISCRVIKRSSSWYDLVTTSYGLDRIHVIYSKNAISFNFSVVTFQLKYTLKCAVNDPKRSQNHSLN